MVAVAYLHQKNIYFGDMKAANLLIFRSQEVKLGDLGISIKLNHDDVAGTEDLYYVKGKTVGYVTKEVDEAEDRGFPISKNELFKCD